MLIMSAAKYGAVHPAAALDTSQLGQAAVKRSTMTVNSNAAGPSTSEAPHAKQRQL